MTDRSISTMSQTAVRGVIFDCDGTLTDTMGLWIDIETELARRAGHVITPDEADLLRAATTPESARWFHETLGVGDSPADVEAEIEAMACDFYATRAQARPGVIPFVRALADAGVALAVASSSPHSMLDPGIVCAGLGDYIPRERIVSVDDVGVSKRDPDVYEEARRRLGTPLESTWVFEDALYAVRTARRGGFHVGAVWDLDFSGTLDELAAEADAAWRGWEDIDVERFLAGGYARQRAAETSVWGETMADGGIRRDETGGDQGEKTPFAADPALVEALAADVPIVILTGHYGVGKTNLALNLAIACSEAGYATTLADLDLVNPYFRSSDYPELLVSRGIGMIEPVFARTALDTPSVSGELFVAVERAVADPEGTRLIIDVGGDDAGATALGRYAHALREAPHAMLHVVNPFRALTREVPEAVAVLREVEAAARMPIDGIVGNAHLEEQTTPADVERGRRWAADVAREARLPLTATCVPAHLRGCCDSWEDGGGRAVYVARYVTTPWNR